MFPYHVQLIFPFQSQSVEYLFPVCFVVYKLADPFVDSLHVVVQLAGGSSVFRCRDEGFHLEWGARHQERKADLFCFPIFLVTATVVGQKVVVERFAQRVAPMAVLRSDGGGQCVGFRLEDKSCTFGVHNVL